MKEKDLPIDRTRHAVYTRKAKKCVLRLLHRWYDDQTCKELWEKIQLQYCEFLRDEPPMAGAKIKVSIYDPILIFAWYKVVSVKPQLEQVQQDIFDCFMGSFDALGKIFNLNRRLDNRLASRIFQKANDIRVEEIRRFPGSFRMGSCSYDRENGVIRYSFTQCLNAEFAKRHHMILLINGARSYWDCCWQFYALFLGAEFFDWLFIDTIWVALSDWWLIPGTEDLNDTWHSVHVKQWKMLQLIPFSVPLAALVGGLYWLIGKMM